MTEPNFWNDKRQSETMIKELNTIKENLSSVDTLKIKTNNNLEMLNNLKSDFDIELKDLCEKECQEIQQQLETLEVSLLLDGPYDRLGAIVDIHSGAGGTEACDWAMMLYRMYTRWCEQKRYKITVIDIQDGEEAGIKSASILVEGTNAFGYLKNEKGVHRLIRLSPFDSNNKRHTSFASIAVEPLFDNNDIDIEIDEIDLRIDIYRSGGHGGQGVNTTDSAVRITHLPTKTVVTCQNERSQIQNKEKALEVLKNRLYQLEIEKKEIELKKIQGGLSDINFGSQIRSYVMHPYSMVKDARTGAETSNVLKVLDGDIDLFINSILRKESKND